MATWYALICLKDQFDSNGKLDYPAGAVKSFGTVLSGDTDELAAKGIEAVALGDFGESGPDFSENRYNSVSKALEPFTPPLTAEQTLLDKPSWDAKDTEDALRLLLSR